MRFLHLSDLHLGKRVCEFSMLEDQRYILEQILALLDETPVDGVLLAGDLYDKPVPPAEAVRLLDWFLTQLAARKLKQKKHLQCLETMQVLTPSVLPLHVKPPPPRGRLSQRRKTFRHPARRPLGEAVAAGD